MIKCRDEFGLLINNKPTRKRAAEKFMLQPPMEPPTDDDEDEVSSPPKKRSRKKLCSFDGCSTGATRRGVCCRHGAKQLRKSSVASTDVLAYHREEESAGGMEQNIR